MWSLCHVLLIIAITAQQSGQQFRLLRADHHLEFAHHPVQVVRAQRVLIRLTPIGAHLSQFRFRTGLICRWLSPPFGGNSQGIPPLGSLGSVVARRVIVHVHVHAANVPYTCRHARGVDEWTTASDDGRVRRRPARPGSATERPHGSDPHVGMGPRRSVPLRRPWGGLARSPAPVTGGFYESAARSNRGTTSTPYQGNTFVISPAKGHLPYLAIRISGWQGQIT